MLSPIVVAALATAVDRLGVPRALKTLRDEVDLFVIDALDDPGDGEAIPVDKSATVPLDIAGTETNTLGHPTFRGQRLTIQCSTRSSGSRAVTAAAAINQAGNTVATFDAAGETLVLEAIEIGSDLRWRVVGNDGATLSSP